MSAAEAAASSSSVERPSLESSTPSSVPTANGKSSSSSTTVDGEDESWQPINTMTDSEIRAELQRVREERDSFESKYRSILSKVTTMRATLGDRLRQDAEELDRKEVQIETLTSKTSELESSISTLRSELISSHGETDRLTSEVDSLRKSLAAKEADVGNRDVQGRLERERELHELVERVKLDAHSWEASCLEERAKREDLESRLVDAEHEVERAQSAERHYQLVAERESASAANLSSVLSEFQSSQESELQRALGDHRAQLDDLSSSLTSWKSRAEIAESQLKENADLTGQAEKLASQVKEKNLLIGKLRHEAVILNEHLTEALRRLRNQQSEGMVDKRLVTNLLISFITTPRADGKRYEMLNLIAGVLGWSGEERESAGLQRSASGTHRPGIGPRGVSSGGAGKREVASAAPNGVGGDESFSNLFVEFLLSEAERGKEGGEEATSGSTTPVLPTRLFSPVGERGVVDPVSPSSEPRSSISTGVTGDETPHKPTGGFGSYFGLSRASKK